MDVKLHSKTEIILNSIMEIFYRYNLSAKLSVASATVFALIGFKPGLAEFNLK